MSAAEGNAMWGISGQTAIVTGAGRGIGKAVALGLAGAGVKVALTDRDAGNLARVASEIEAVGGIAYVFPCDIADLAKIEELFAGTMERFGDIDILLNVAGMQTTTSLLEYTQENWDLHMAVNLRAVAFTSQAAARIMIPKGRGKIVNISSTSGFVASTNPKAAYDVSKAGVRHMTVSLGKELSRFGINVNSVAPGTIATDMTLPWLSTAEGLDRSLARIPLGRIGQAEDVVGPVLFLCSPYSNYIVGHTVVVDGGWLL